MLKTKLFKSIVCMYALLFMVCGLGLSASYAQADGGTICSPTDVTDSVSSSTADVYICVNNVYKYAIVLGAIVSVLYIVIAGYMYMFSGSSEEYVSTAKSMILSSLVGMVVLLAGLLLIKQINPALLELKTLSPERIANQDWVLPTAGGTIPSGGGRLPSGGKPGGNGGTLPPGGKCLGSKCPPLDNPVDLKAKGISCKNNCVVLAGGDAKLVALKAYTDKNGPAWRLTEAYPPTSQHSSPCHYNGRCVDLNPLEKTASNYDRMCVALKAVGLVNFLNEAVTTQNCGAGKTTTFGTGAHLHVILF